VTIAALLFFLSHLRKTKRGKWENVHVENGKGKKDRGSLLMSNNVAMVFLS
jgi:hypothetical protein